MSFLPVAERAVLREKRRASSSGGLVRLGSKSEKLACRSCLLRRRLGFISLLYAFLDAHLRLLGSGHDRHIQDASEKQCGAY